MSNIQSLVLTEILGARRFKWHGMLAAWLVCLAGWVGVALMPNTYESKAILHIDTDSVLRPLLADLAVNTNVMSEVRMMSEILLSRPQLERVVRDTDLDLRAGNPSEMEELLTDIRQRIQVSGNSPRNSFNPQNIYTIKFVDSDPKTVHAVVQSLLDSFVESSLGKNKADSAGAQDFIESQVEKYENRLSDAESQLAEFKRRNVGMMPGEVRDYYLRMQNERDDLEDLEKQHASLLTRRREMQKQLDGEQPSFGLLTPPDSGSAPAVQNADSSEIEAFERELSSLLLKYTEKHPKVVDLRNRIEQSRAQIAATDQGPADVAGPVLGTRLDGMNVLNRNPVYQNLKIAIVQANTDLSEISEKITSAGLRVQRLRALVDKVPEIEAQLARLNRDYEVNKTQYTALLRRLESARLSEQAELQTEDIKFRIIEPPVVPVQPTGPDRSMFAAIVLVAGFGFGGALAFLLNFLSPVFNSADEVRRTLELPVLGSIPAFTSAEEKAVSKRSIRRFLYAATGLVAMYVGTIFIWPMVTYIKQAFVGGAT